jgi:hypothetical protein
MQCLKETHMRKRNMNNAPSNVSPAEQKRRGQLGETEKIRVSGNTALTQIVCLEGIAVYKRGG